MGRLLPAAFEAVWVRYRRYLAVGARKIEGRLSPPSVAIGWPNPKTFA
jgi:hypothetical protein